MKIWRAGFTFILLAALGAFLQGTDIPVIASVKLNVSLALAAALSFYIPSPWTFGLAIGAGAAVLSGAGAGIRELIVLVLIAFAMFAIGTRLPGKTFANSGALAAIGTFLFYLGADAAFLAESPGAAAFEAFMNGVLAAALLILCRLFFKETHAQKIRTAF